MKKKNFQKLKKDIILALLAFGITLTAASFTYARYYYDDDYPEIYNAYWDNRTARWDVNGYATKFEVRLYKNGHQVVTTTTSQESMNMSQHLHHGSGDYYFDVRPYNHYTGWGNWMGSDSIYLDGHYYDDYDRYYDDRYYDDRYYYDHYYDNSLWNQDISYARNDGPPINQSQNKANVIMPNNNYSNVAPGSLQQQNQNSGINAYNKQVLTVPTSQIIYQQANGESSFGKFVEVYGLWHFIFDNGVPATNTWVQYKNKWYYMDLSGIMATGLYTINGKTYYLNTDGSMIVGTLVLDGITHFFNNNGEMVY